MDISRTMKSRRRAVRKLVESFGNEENKSKVEDEGFKFPPPPKPPNGGSSFRESTDTSDTCSDQSSVRGDTCQCPQKRAIDHGYRSDGSPPHRLPPIGVFWDIENCQIPHGKSAILVAQAVRERFFKGFREAEFIVVCDVKKESPLVVQELNDAQVNLIHVASTSKNAADEKLRQSMRRFADIHGFPAAIILISGDINFASDLCDLRHRKKLHIILLHNSACSIALILCANEHYNFDQFVMPLPTRGMTKQNFKNGPMEVMVWNLPKQHRTPKVKERLKILSDNCGGRVTFISETVAVIRFPSFDLASRAHKRMNGEIMYGNQIGVSYPQRAGTLKRETNSTSNGLYGNVSFGTGRTPSQNNSNGMNGLLGIENNFHPYFRSASLQETASNLPRNLPAENPWFWDKSDVPTGNFSNGFQKKNLVKDDLFLPKSDNLLYGSAYGKESDTHPVNQNGRMDVGMKSKDGNREPEPLWPNSKNVGVVRKFRTPPPYLVKPKATTPIPPNQLRKSFPPDNFDTEKYFNPIQTPYSQSTPVELHITNLDQSIEPMEIKKILQSMFGEHVMVLHVSVFIQSDGNFAASVKVPSIQDAQYAISQLHRKKIGYKRITISYAHSNHQHNPQFVRWQVINLLQEVPEYKLPLFQFLKLFESRYVTNISLSELYRLKDVCTITDESTGRVVFLNQELRSAPSPSFSSSQDIEPYCNRHYWARTCFGKGWAEQEVPPLPNVIVPLKEFSAAVTSLISSHNNALPLSSFVDCYEGEIGRLKISETGVPLEHLVTCVSRVELAVANGVKYLRPAPPHNFLDDKAEDASKCVSPSLVNQLSQFGRELVDLLRTQPHCLLVFNRLIPAYHHHFGRQCRVADYGFTKLIDLLEAIPNIAQVIGEGNKRVVTLSHRAQVKRFVTDLLRALKSQPSKKFTIEELPQVFESVLGKPFDPVDYGLCTLADLLETVPESTVVISRGQITTTLSITKREQTPEEVERTKLFAKEVVELLGHAPQCSILFHQFIPAYHHHYGHQCRVADFGFSKLIELFEAIPDIVKVEDDGEGERKVSLTKEQKLYVVGQQICDIVIPTHPPGYPLDQLPPAFRWQYGYALRPQTYELNSLEELIQSLDTVRLERSEFGTVVVPVEEALVRQLTAQVKKYLLHSKNGRIKFSKLISYFSSFHASYLTPATLTKNLPDAVRIVKEDGEDTLELTEMYELGRRVVHILKNNNGHMSLSALEASYANEAGGLGYAGKSSLAAALAAIPSVATVKGRSFKRHVILNKFLVLRKETNDAEKIICRPNSTSFLPSKTMDNLEDRPQMNWPGDAREGTPMVTLPEMVALPENLHELASSMLSPCKLLLPPSARPPHPSQLPIPFNLSPRPLQNGFPNRGGGDIKGQDKENASALAMKRKIRLAAHFENPPDLN